MARFAKSISRVALVPALCLWSDVVSAQTLTVQQPVIGQFGVGTTVSVPDRGSALLGSVSRARDSVSSFGPLDRFGSSVGLDRSHTSASVSVYVHDFEAMDRALLGEDFRPTTARRSSSREVHHAEATSALVRRWSRRRHRGAGTSIARATPTSRSSRTTRPDSSPTVNTARRSSAAAAYYKLALKAEEQSDSRKARRYFRKAAELGHAEAALRVPSDSEAVAAK